jgi:hypothetical protein
MELVTKKRIFSYSGSSFWLPLSGTRGNDTVQQHYQYGKLRPAVNLHDVPLLTRIQ